MGVLIVASAPAPDVMGALGRLPQRARRVIAVDGGADHCMASGVIPDLLIGDLDSIGERTLSTLRAAGVEVVVHPTDKDESDLDLALAELRRRRWDGPLVLTGVFGGRLDHTLAALGSLGRAADLSPEALEQDVHAWLLSARGRGVLRVDEPGAILTIIAVTPATASADGLRWPLVQTELHPLDSLGLSNVVVAPGASIRCERGVVLVTVLRMRESSTPAPQTPKH